MTTEHLNHLQLARLATGELPPAEADRAHAHLAGCAACAAAHRELTERAADFLSNEDARLAALHARVAEPAPRPALGWLRPLLGVSGLLAVAAAVVLVVRAEPEPDTAFKGTASLAAVVRRGEVQRPLVDGDEVAPGDAVRLVVTTDGPVYFAAAWVDGAGAATLLYPATPREPPLRLEERGRTALEGSFVLDEAPGDERLVWRFSTDEFRVGDFLAGLSRGGATSGTLRLRKPR